MATKTLGRIKDQLNEFHERLNSLEHIIAKEEEDQNGEIDGAFMLERHEQKFNDLEAEIVDLNKRMNFLYDLLEKIGEKLDVKIENGDYHREYN